MSGCGITCVIFIWVSFLWPVIVSGAYLTIKQNIEKQGKYFLISTVLGYILLVSSNFLVSYLAAILIKGGFTEGKELYVNPVIWLTVVLLYLPPVISSHALAKKYS